MAKTYELNGNTWVEIVDADDVTPEVLAAAEDAETWFGDGRIDWQEFFDDRLEGTFLPNGDRISLGNEYDTPAQRKIKRHINHLRRTS